MRDTLCTYVIDKPWFDQKVFFLNHLRFDSKMESVVGIWSNRYRYKYNSVYGGVHKWRHYQGGHGFCDDSTLALVLKKRDGRGFQICVTSFMDDPPPYIKPKTSFHLIIHKLRVNQETGLWLIEICTKKVEWWVW